MILGGGGQNMGIKSADPIDNGCCVRKDGKNLVENWKKLNPDGKFVSNTAELFSIDISNASKLMGVFSSSHMPYHEVRTSETPTLANMTLQAIRILKKNKNGFFLMVSIYRAID